MTKVVKLLWVLYFGCALAYAGAETDDEARLAWAESAFSHLINGEPQALSGDEPEVAGFASATPTEQDKNVVDNDILSRLKVDEVITPETTELIGDRIDLNSGSLSFHQTDISLPGNSSLPVAVQRVFRGNNFTFLNKAEFGDWQLDIPNIQTTLFFGGGKFSGSWATGRECSGQLNPGAMFASGSLVYSYQYWNGDTLNVPGTVNDKLLTPTNSFYFEGTTESITRVTKSNWRFSCIVRQNEQGVIIGEGFKGYAPDGNVYTFDEFRMLEVNANLKAGLKYQAFMMVSRIEDRFGNWVVYDYDEQGKIQSISANDGRLIEFIYGNTIDPTKISEIKANNHLWQYKYSGTDEQKLQTVILPDNRYWQFSLGGLNGDAKALSQDNDDCKFNSPNTITYSDFIIHPNGTKGTFYIKETLHGRSNVSKLVSKDESANLIIPRCFASMALVKKTLEVPGSDSNLDWYYNYSQNKGVFAGDTVQANERLTLSNLPAHITSSNDTDYKATIMTAPDGSKTRYFYNRDYTSVLDGSLIVTQYFDVDNSDTILKTELTTLTQGAGLGHPSMQYENTLPNQYRVQADEKTISLNNGDVYTTNNTSFDTYGAVLESNAYQNAANKRYTRQSYTHDTERWLLNQPTTTEISSDGSNYSTMFETSYYAKDHANYPFMPYEQKSFGTWQKRYVSYHGDGNVNKVEFNAPLTAGTGNRFVAYSNYQRGQPQTITVPKRYSTAAMTVGRTIDDNGWVTQTTDLNGNKINYGYDALGRIQYIDPVDTRWLDTVFAWSTDGGAGADQPTRTVTRCSLDAYKTCITNTEKLQTTTTYDGLLRAREVKTTDIALNTSVYQHFDYNAYNKQSFVSWPSSTSGASNGEHYAYDGLQRLVKKSVDNGGVQTTTYLAGNKIKVNDFNGYDTTTSYLAYGAPSYEQAIHIESPESVTTTLGVNVFGEVTSITQGGQTQTYLYNNHQLCMVKRNDIGNSYYARNHLGEVTWQAQGVSGTSCAAHGATATQKVTSAYDNLGSQHTLSYADGKTPNVTYSLDNNGDVKTLVSGNVSQTYDYNSARLLEKETLALEGKAFTLDYVYDNLGNPSALVYPDAAVGQVNFMPNAFGQARQVNRGSYYYAKSAVYHPNGLVNTFTFGNGVQHETLLNNRNMPQAIRDYKGSSHKIYLAYGYDNQNNITSLNDNIDNSYSLTSLRYDGLDRLTSTSGGSKIGNSSIGYDFLGNIKSYSNSSSIKSHNLSYTYNTNNRLTSVTGNGAAGYNFNQANSYDNRGNVTHNGMRGFTYNLADQMTASDGNSYVYDGYNRRVKTVDSHGTSYSMYSQSGRLLYREVNGNPVSYLYLGDKLVAKDGVMLASSDSNMHYKPFGDSIEQAKDDVGYTGHKFDTDLNLSYMQARYYDPVIGRFYSNDPVGWTPSNPVMSFNRYLYVNNNPYKYTDPDGEFLWGAVVGAAAEIAVQMVVEGKGFSDLDVGRIGSSAAIGLVSGGIGGATAKLASHLGKAVVGTSSAMKPGVSRVLAEGTKGSISGAYTAATSSTLTQLTDTGTVDLGKVGSDTVKGAVFGSAGGAAAGKLQSNASQKILGDSRAQRLWSSKQPGATAGNIAGNSVGAATSIADSVTSACEKNGGC